ncbi:MAG: hypothetical protein WCO56_16405 [Verrucomicrobiota bacterium]
MTRGALQRDAQPNFYLYRQVMGKHSQVGLVAAYAMLLWSNICMP